MYEQAILSVEDPQVFAAVHQAIESAFAPANITKFLKSIERANQRIRHFEDILAAKLLGISTHNEYGQLGNADQGQIREFYLASLEQVAPDLRQKFFKLYAYY